MGSESPIARPRSKATSLVVAGFHRAVALLLFAVAIGFLALSWKSGLTWFELAVIALLLVKGLLAWFFARRRSGIPHPGTLLRPIEWKIVGIGYLVVAAAFAMAVLRGQERLISLVGVMSCLAAGATLLRISAGRFGEQPAA